MRVYEVVWSWIVAAYWQFHLAWVVLNQVTSPLYVLSGDLFFFFGRVAVCMQCPGRAQARTETQDCGDWRWARAGSGRLGGDVSQSWPAERARGADLARREAHVQVEGVPVRMASLVLVRLAAAVKPVVG